MIRKEELLSVHEALLNRSRSGGVIVRVEINRAGIISQIKRKNNVTEAHKKKSIALNSVYSVQFFFKYPI